MAPNKMPKCALGRSGWVYPCTLTAAGVGSVLGNPGEAWNYLADAVSIRWPKSQRLVTIAAILACVWLCLLQIPFHRTFLALRRAKKPFSRFQVSLLVADLVGVLTILPNILDASWLKLSMNGMLCLSRPFYGLTQFIAYHLPIAVQLSNRFLLLFSVADRIQAMKHPVSYLLVNKNRRCAAANGISYGLAMAIVSIAFGVQLGRAPDIPTNSPSQIECAINKSFLAKSVEQCDSGRTYLAVSLTGNLVCSIRIPKTLTYHLTTWLGAINNVVDVVMVVSTLVMLRRFLAHLNNRSNNRAFLNSTDEQVVDRVTVGVGLEALLVFLTSSVGTLERLFVTLFHNNLIPRDLFSLLFNPLRVTAWAAVYVQLFLSPFLILASSKEFLNTFITIPLIPGIKCGSGLIQIPLLIACIIGLVIVSTAVVYGLLLILV